MALTRTFLCDVLASGESQGRPGGAKEDLSRDERAPTSASCRGDGEGGCRGGRRDRQPYVGSSENSDEMDSPLVMRRIASANSGATEMTSRLLRPST